ncbi:hypothetical protein HMPREF1611_02821 [Escherichia coli 908573]|nr:hypothetical protein HMPREF1611_02821 [Escherichia coli 908573]DAN10534.1 MAG TPA: hypothetical protein [Caudoviricetes sp.]
MTFLQSSILRRPEDKKLSKLVMQNVTSTAIDLFGPCNCSQNGGDLKSDPEKVRKSGTQKLASSHSHQLDRTPRALSVTG